MSEGIIEATADGQEKPKVKNPAEQIAEFLDAVGLKIQIVQMFVDGLPAKPEVRLVPKDPPVEKPTLLIPEEE